MNLRANVRLLLRSSGSWIAVLAIPVLANVLLWRALVMPQRSRLLTWQNEQRLTELKPKLAALVSESEAMLTQMERGGVHDDASEAMQTIQRLAGRHRVQLKELSASGAQTTKKADAHGLTAAAVQVQVSGRFSRLARWISDVEATSGLLIDSLTLAPGKNVGEPHQLTVQLSALVGEAS